MAEDPWIGRTIDRRYLIRKQLGSGGMGVVYEADHVGLDRRVAIKLMRTEHVAPDLLERFRREARLASRVTHPNIVQTLDVGDDGGVDFIAMELVDGKDLGALLRDGPLPIDRAVAIAQDMLRALAAIHDAGIIHRDIKPSNVLIARDGTVKLMDFGIARGLADPALTRTGHVVGTTEFMAPEQLRGKEVDHRADLYAVGITLFAMLAGELPFRGDTAALVGAHVFQAPPSLAKLRPDVPAHVVRAVERALAKTPVERFTDASAFAAALAGAPEEPRAEAATVAERRGARVEPPHRRGRMLAVVAIAVAVPATIAVIAWVNRSPDRASSVHDAALASGPAIAPVDDAALSRVDDAAVVALAPRDASPRDASTTHASPPVGRTSPHTCNCIPTNAPDVIPLCKQTSGVFCRCEDAKGRVLCERPLTAACHATDGNPCDTKHVSCPYPPASYSMPGHTGAPCSGSDPPWAANAVDGRYTPETISGHQNCDACAGTELRNYVGENDQPCEGFYWRTAEPMTGKLGFCH